MDSNAPNTSPATATAAMLAAAADAYIAGKTVRKNAAKAAQASGTSYRDIAAALNISTTRAHALVNEDAA